MTRGGSTDAIAEQEGPAATVRPESPHCITHTDTELMHSKLEKLTTCAHALHPQKSSFSTGVFHARTQPSHHSSSE